MIKIISSFLLAIMFIACSDAEEHTKNEQSGLYNLGNGVYVKKVSLDGYISFIYTNENGVPLINKPLSTHYSSGKASYTVTSFPPVSDLSSSKKFVFECDELEDCENKIKVVKESIR